MLRKSKRREIPFELFRVFTFGSRQELVASFGTMGRAEEAWRAVRDEFLARWDMWGRPAAWWHFEPGIPDELRTGPHAIVSDADAGAWRRLEEGRRSYLRSLGIDPTPRRS